MGLALNRRKVIIAMAGAAIGTGLPRASAQPFRDAVINFIETNYDRSLRDMTRSGLRYLVEKVLPIENDLLNAALDLGVHFDQNWSRSGPESTRSHTAKCPYCISVAKEVERRAQELDPIRDRTPKCFMINGAQYVASEWGSLHRYHNGAIGGAEGAIWFEHGEYVGRGNNGQRFMARPNC